MGKWVREIIDWIGRWQTLQSILAILKPILGPSLVALLAIGTGVYGHQPWMFIVVASALAFMAAMVGIFFLGLYRQRNSPTNKILYLGTQVNYDLVPLVRKARKAQATGVAPARVLEKIQIGVSLHNSAPYPLSIQLVRAETEMEGEKPPRSMFPKSPTTILPGNTMLVLDDAIQMGGHPCEKIEGHMDLTVKYGFPGKEKYELHFAGRVEALMNPQGFLQGTYTHWDSELASIPTR